MATGGRRIGGKPKGFQSAATLDKIAAREFVRQRVTAALGPLLDAQLANAKVSDMSEELSHWLTKQQAADMIGVSTKAIERFTRAGKLQQSFRAQAGSPHVAVYEPGDVARMAAERQPGPVPAFVVPGPPVPPIVPTNGNGHGSEALARVPSTGLPAILPGEDLLRALVTAAVRVMSETSQTSSLFVTIAQASAITGLTRSYIRRQIANGTLRAERDVRWKIRRKDLEGL